MRLWFRKMLNNGGVGGKGEDTQHPPTQLTTHGTRFAPTQLMTHGARHASTRHASTQHSPTQLTTHDIRHALAQHGYSEATPENIMNIHRDLQQRGDRHGIPHSVEDLRCVQRELSGLGLLGEIFTDPTVTDVLVNPDGTVWQDNGHGLQRSHIGPLEAEHVRELATHMAARCGSRLDHAMPFADGVLTDLPQDIPAHGIRLHAALGPPVQGGTSISLRSLSPGLGTIEQLAATGLMPNHIAERLRTLVRQRKNILISGGTGAGKTSLLTALLAAVPHDQRLVIVEDTPEIIAQHPHTVSMTSRRANAEGAGDIPMSQLVKQSLRMRPDRLVIGEIRGAEIADLLVALNTGHAGSAGTIHANSIAAVPGRLEALGAMAGMPARSVVRQALDGIDVLVHVERTPVGRRVTHIGRLVPGADGQGLSTRTLWHYQEAQHPEQGHTHVDGTHADPGNADGTHADRAHNHQEAQWDH